MNSKETHKGIKYIGGGWDNPIEALQWITRNDEVWCVMLREGSPLGHEVLIYGEDENSLIMIKDPFDQTSYKMTAENLQKVLSEFV